MLEDKFGRRFHYLRLSITDVCNFRCQYCLPDGYQADNDRQFLSTDEAHTVVKAFAMLGTSKVRITGGEPALRKDLTDIIERTAAVDGIDQVAITTNGFNLPQKIDAWHQAGLGQLNVSVDSFDPRQFHSITGHDKLDTILTGIDRALALGLKVKVNSVLMRQYNDGELSHFLNWVKDQPVTLRFIELMQTGENKNFFQANHVSGASIKQTLVNEGWQQVIREKTAGPAQEFYHPDYTGRVGLIMPYGQDFCASCNRLRISAIGQLHLCLFAEHGIDLRPVIASGDSDALAQHLREQLGNKEATHYLHEGLTGATKHLAMLGG